MTKKREKLSKETEIVHGIVPDQTVSADLVPPIHMTSTFKFNSADHGAALFSGTEDGYIYTRVSNPTNSVLEKKVSLLEGGDAGIATSSGMAAIASVAMTLAKPGDNFVSCTTVYGGTFAFFHHRLRELKIDPRFVSPVSATDPAMIEKQIDADTRFLYMETPANPTLDIIDIRLWADIAQAHGIPLVVDNTFATPYLQNPIYHGADLVVHSATKYLGGHADIIGGLVVGSRSLTDRIREEYIHNFGPTMSPFNAWLFLRGIKTLAVRMEKHCANAVRIARFLEDHPKVEKVYYPGLPSHSGHITAKKQMCHFGGMIAFEVVGGIDAGKKIMDNVEICTLAVSLGDCDTLIQHPASMTHATYSKAEREKAGITDGLIRLSVGIENADDIIADLENAMALLG
jgi:methionine-gamma-lyase